MSRDYRVALLHRLAVYPDFTVVVGGPLPNNDDAAIALMEHLWDDPEARYQIRRLCRRAFPGARIPSEPDDSALRRTIRKIIRAVTAPSNVGRARAAVADRDPQGASGPTS